MTTPAFHGESLVSWRDVLVSFAALPGGLEDDVRRACQQRLALAFGFEYRPGSEEAEVEREEEQAEGIGGATPLKPTLPAPTVPSGLNDVTGEWPGKARSAEFRVVSEYERTAAFGDAGARKSQAVLRWRRRPERRLPFLPIAGWSEIEPRLRRVFPGRRRGESISVDKAVLWAAEMRVDQPVPLQHRRSWGPTLVVIIDDSKRMEPYDADFQRQLEQLIRIFGAASVSWFYAETPDAICSPKRFTAADRLLRDRRWCIPPAGTPVLVLGDLGLLDAAGPGLAQRWRKFGERLRQRGCVPLALLPGSPAVFQPWPEEVCRDYERELHRIAQVFAMQSCQSRTSLPDSLSARRRLVDRLASWLTFQVRVEPQLLRRLRWLLPGGADAAIEAAVWQHPLLIGRSSIAATPGTGTEPERQLCEFEQESLELRQRVLETWRRSRSHTAAEIYFEELGRLSQQSSRLMPLEDREDMADAWRYLAQNTLASAQRGTVDYQGREAMIAAYAKRALGRCIGDLEVKPEISEAVGQIRSVLEGRALPTRSDTEDVVEIWQQGSSLILRCLSLTHPQPPAPPRHSLIGSLRKYGRAVRVLPSDSMAAVQLEPGQVERLEMVARRRLQIRSDLECLTLGLTSRPAWAVAAGRDTYGVWADCVVGTVRQRWRWIPPGSFQMGSPEDEPGRRENEGPRHWVRLTRGFWMMDTACTQGLWESVMTGEKNPSRFRDVERPVEQVSWEDVQRFVARLNETVPDLSSCLPTEAQWEYACRAGSESALYRTAGTSGAIEILGQHNAPALDAIAWYGGNSGVGFELENGWNSGDWSEKQYPHTTAGSRRVGTRQPNAWGLYDMLGNVWEWCMDSQRKYRSEGEVDPLGAGVESRAIRGGGWNDDARFVRCACRYQFSPQGRGYFLGFRLVRVQDQR